MSTLSLKQWTLEAAKLAEKVLYTCFQSLVKNHQSIKNLTENKKIALRKKMQQVISISVQIIYDIDKKVQIFLTLTWNNSNHYKVKLKFKIQEHQWD